MKQYIILYAFQIFAIQLLNGQTDSSFIQGDTLTSLWYYKNGILQFKEVAIKGRDEFTYLNTSWYHKNGKPEFINYYDSFNDTTFYLSGRRNGTIKYQYVRSKGYYRSIRENRKGFLTKEVINDKYSDTTIVHHYKNGKLINTEVDVKEKSENKYLNKYEIIEFYEGQIGGSSGVIIYNQNDSLVYNVDGELMGKDKYTEYEKKYNDYIDSRMKTHYYKYYTADSSLLYEGLFKDVDLPCGYFIQYYESGNIEMRGYYNDEGKEEGFWRFYNLDGLLFEIKKFENGKEVKI